MRLTALAQSNWPRPFFNAGLSQRIREIEREIIQGVVNQNILSVLAEIRATKSFKAWAGAVIENLGVNFLTIVLIGALLGGYQALVRFNANLEKIANVPPAGEVARKAPERESGQ